MRAEIIDLPKIVDYRGSIAVVEKDTLPFPIKRVYYLFDIPSSARRGGHAHKEVSELLIPISGSFDVLLRDGKEQKIFTLNKPDRGLIIRNNVWRELENFSAGAVCLVIASEIFEEDDYIRDYDEYVAYVNGRS